jgi:hypothetical protein
MTAMLDKTVPDKPKEDTIADAVAEQEKHGIEYTGFEEDEDFADLPDKLLEVFGKELLNLCLISRITYYPDTVLVAVEGQHYAVPAEEYEALAASLPQMTTSRFRAFSVANYNLHPAMKHYQRTPIAVYSFVGESLDEKDYLPAADEASQMRHYKLGTVVHEVAHHIWNNVLAAEQRQKWGALNREANPLTKYAESYTGKQGWDEEQFGEAVRLQVTSKEYLQEASIDAADFIAKTLPQIGSL